MRDVTGFAIGGIPPLGHDTPLATFMDEALLAYDVVWAAAGTPDAVFPIAPAQLAEAAAAARHPRRLSRTLLAVPALAQERPQDVGIVVGPGPQAAVVELAASP